MKKIFKTLPNIITSIRIIGAIVIFFLEPFSLVFYIVYGVCGISDALDGFIARKFHLESKFGTILDSVSDLIFLGIMGFKIFPTLIELLDVWCWFMIGIPVLLQIIGYIICAIKFKKFSAIHTYANKTMSAAIFFFPFTFIGFIKLIYEIYLGVFGTVAIFAGIEIVLIHLLTKEYSDKNKSIFLLKKNESDQIEE